LGPWATPDLGEVINTIAAPANQEVAQ